MRRVLDFLAQFRFQFSRSRKSARVEFKLTPGSTANKQRLRREWRIQPRKEKDQ